MNIRFFKKKETTLPANMIIERIVGYLEKEDYVITYKTTSSVKFRDKLFVLRSRAKGYRMIDKGEFEITSHGTGHFLVCFKYYQSLWPVLILLAFFSYGCVEWQSFLPLLIWFILCAIAVSVRVLIYINSGSDIINSITDSN